MHITDAGPEIPALTERRLDLETCLVAPDLRDKLFRVDPRQLTSKLPAPSFPRDLAQSAWIFDQAIQDTGTALGRFIGEDRAPVVSGGQRLAKNLTLFKLKGDCDSAQERMLYGRDRFGGVGIRIDEAQQKRVLAITHDRHDADRSHDIGRHIDIRFLVFRLRPVAAARIDVEAKDGLGG